MKETSTIKRSREQLRVRGFALLVAVAVVAVLVGGALWAAQVDLNSEMERNAVPLDILATLYKVIAGVGLFVVGRRLGSRSFNLLALMMVALTAGSLAVDVDWFHNITDPMADVVADIFGVSPWAASLGIVFAALAVVGVWLVVLALRAMQDFEKPTVWTLLGLLAILGVFLGPVNAISSLGINREWLFAEDFGQVMTLAVIGGYVAGLVAATRVGSK